MKRHSAVFLDRDGTIIVDAHYISDPDRVRLYRGAARALMDLKKAGFLLIVVSNQSGVGRGWVSESSVFEINKRLALLLKREAGVHLDDIYYCPHKPQDDCSCRKPKTELIDRAVRQWRIDPKNSYMVGDKITDMELSHNIGAQGVFLLTGHGREERGVVECRLGKTGIHIAGTLTSAAKWILDQDRRRRFS
ncbi:MAG: HAD family hydrolase [Elusimicrobia bacterium]|nr:HAD family hydrolase [Elusimicrobiota bacterium]